MRTASTSSGQPKMFALYQVSAYRTEKYDVEHGRQNRRGRPPLENVVMLDAWRRRTVSDRV